MFTFSLSSACQYLETGNQAPYGTPHNALHTVHAQKHVRGVSKSLNPFVGVRIALKLDWELVGCTSVS